MVFSRVHELTVQDSEHLSGQGNICIRLGMSIDNNGKA